MFIRVFYFISFGTRYEILPKCYIAGCWLVWHHVSSLFVFRLFFPFRFHFLGNQWISHHTFAFRNNNRLWSLWGFFRFFFFPFFFLSLSCTASVSVVSMFLLLSFILLCLLDCLVESTLEWGWWIGSTFFSFNDWIYLRILYFFYFFLFFNLKVQVPFVKPFSVFRLTLNAYSNFIYHSPSHMPKHRSAHMNSSKWASISTKKWFIDEILKQFAFLTSQSERKQRFIAWRMCGWQFSSDCDFDSVEFPWPRRLDELIDCSHQINAECLMHRSWQSPQSIYSVENWQSGNMQIITITVTAKRNYGRRFISNATHPVRSQNKLNNCEWQRTKKQPTQLKLHHD